MSLTKGFIVGDIINYEITEDVNILEELGYGNIDMIINCLIMSNKCSEKDACDYLAVLKMTYELTEIIKMIALDLVGKEPEEDKKTSENKEIKKLSDILLESYVELKTYDDRLDFNTFLSMNTRLLWKYADTVKQIYINNENKRLKDLWWFCCIFFGMFTGTLKECPQLNSDENSKSMREMLIEKYKAVKGK